MSKLNSKRVNKSEQSPGARFLSYVLVVLLTGLMRACINSLEAISQTETTSATRLSEAPTCEGSLPVRFVGIGEEDQRDVRIQLHLSLRLGWTMDYENADEVTKQTVFVDSTGRVSIKGEGSFLATPAPYAVAADGTVLEVQVADPESLLLSELMINALDDVSCKGTLLCQPVPMADLSDEDIEEAMQTVENDPERSSATSDYRAAILAKRDEARAARESVHAQVDNQLLAESFGRILDSTDQIGFGDEREGLNPEETRDRYALAEMTGDGIPDLLLRRDVRAAGEPADTWHSYIRFVRYDVAMQEAILVGPDTGVGVDDAEWSAFELADVNYGYELNSDSVDFKHYLGWDDTRHYLCDVFTLSVLSRDEADADVTIPGVELIENRTDIIRLTLTDSGLVQEELGEVLHDYSSLHYYATTNREPLADVAAGEWDA